MRSTFDHPELFFLHTAGYPSSAAAFDAGNLDSGHHRPALAPLTTPAASPDPSEAHTHAESH